MNNNEKVQEITHEFARRMKAVGMKHHQLCERAEITGRGWWKLRNGLVKDPSIFTIERIRLALEAAEAEQKTQEIINQGEHHEEN